VGEGLGVQNHVTEHAADPIAALVKRSPLFCRQVSIGVGSVEPVAGFLQFGVGVRELADEMCGIAALRPLRGVAQSSFLQPLKPPTTRAFELALEPSSFGTREA
jgi:hypothetical protein